jgi:prevent-host-death family protein
MTMKTIPAGEFKARCLKLMDEVAERRIRVRITKKGRPVAELVPLEAEGDDPAGCLAGRLEILGDLVAPVVPAEDWDALG